MNDIQFLAIISIIVIAGLLAIIVHSFTKNEKLLALLKSVNLTMIGHADADGNTIIQMFCPFCKLPPKEVNGHWQSQHSPTCGFGPIFGGVVGDDYKLPMENIPWKEKEDDDYQQEDRHAMTSE